MSPSGSQPEGTPAARAAARGVVAAMAMTGFRAFTKGVGLLDAAPPELVVERAAPRALARLSPRARAAATEIAHWSYGAAAGVVFGVLPGGVRRARWAGPAYGLASWLAFEAVLVPALGLDRLRRDGAGARVAVALDHVLYGVVVADRLPSERARGAR